MYPVPQFNSKIGLLESCDSWYVLLDQSRSLRSPGDCFLVVVPTVSEEPGILKVFSLH
jgi:hypothetical protein